jgi:hypothetical protein
MKKRIKYLINAIKCQISLLPTDSVIPDHTVLSDNGEN